VKGKLIIIEAGDGSGKATQAARLSERLAAEGYRVRQVSYPNYQSNSSALVKMYLSGEFGSRPEDVNPYAASAFYTVDRYASYKKDWEKFYQSGGIVIADRYTTSNMVHQAVKLSDPAERRCFLDWLWDFEFVKCGLPVPDCVIFLDMPPAYSRRLLADRPGKHGERDKDIHERNQQYLEDCYANACAIAQYYHWHRVSCVSEGRIKTVDEIHKAIYEIVKPVVDGL